MLWNWNGKRNSVAIAQGRVGEGQEYCPNSQFS